MDELSPDDIEACLRILQRIADQPELADEHERLKSLVSKVNRHGRKQKRRVLAQEDREADRRVSESTTRCQAASPETSFPPVQMMELRRARRCYVCKAPYVSVHFHYHLLCPACAEENMARRDPQADLAGRVVLITGGRIKIGLQAALLLLRQGAMVHVTTRFPASAADAYRVQEDFHLWRHRLHIHALDLRNIPRVEAFAEELTRSLSHLDILINNAAQTIKRPLAYYRELLAAEHEPPVLLEAGTQALPIPENVLALFPSGALTAEGQPLDLRDANSWTTELGDLETAELLEVHLVNAIAPCLLTARLKRLLLRSPHERRFVIQVSAMEGQFGWKNKTSDHPHTNMAKAALNMLTRTAAADYARDGIYMNSVDTGWITQEKPHAEAIHLREQGFVPPLDVLDGAARIIAPIVDGLNGDDTPAHGQFFKDYRSHPW